MLVRHPAVRSNPMRAILLSLSLLAAAAFAPAQAQQAALPGLTEGNEYRLVEAGKPYRAVPGKIEVAEVFAYWCPHCAHFDPMLDAWKRKLPASARFVAVPLVSGPDDAWGRAFFAAEASKALPLLHTRLFKAVHETEQLPRNATLAQIDAFVARVPGVNQKAYAAAVKDDAGLRAKLSDAYQFALRSDIPGTPSLVINGKYLVLGNSYQALLDNADRIIKAIAPAAPKPTPKPAAAKAKPRA